MRRMAGVILGTLLLTSGTGCALTIREAVKKDSWTNSKAQDSRERVQPPEEESSEPCPPDMIHYEDCRTIPCTVTCKDPEDTKR